MEPQFSKVEDAIEALRRGGVVIVVDDEDRENEGDFVAAAESVTPETIAFMTAHGQGMVCAPILPEEARRLDLRLMVEQNTSTDAVARSWSTAPPRPTCPPATAAAGSSATPWTSSRSSPWSSRWATS